MNNTCGQPHCRHHQPEKVFVLANWRVQLLVKIVFQLHGYVGPSIVGQAFLVAAESEGILAAYKGS